MPIGSAGVDGNSRHSSSSAALDVLALVSDPDLYAERIKELDTRQAKIAADLATLAARRKEGVTERGELDEREKAVETREDVATERETAQDDRDTKLEAREETVKERQAECRRVEGENKRRGDKMKARARALADAAGMLMQHDAMEGIGAFKVG